MPRVNVPQKQWTELTVSDVSSLTFQNLSGQHVLVSATSGAAPTDFENVIRYNPGQGERNVSLSDLFPGLSAVRVWAFSDNGASIMVSHA